MFTNNILNEDQVKQIEENSTKETYIPLFNSNKFFDKPSNDSLGFKTNSFLDILSSPNIFTKDIKLYNQLQPKINANNQEIKNVLENNSLTLTNNLNNNLNEQIKININSNTNKNLFDIVEINNKNNVNSSNLVNNTSNIPVFPSFLNKEGSQNNVLFMNTEKNVNNNINSNIMNTKNYIYNLNHSIHYLVNKDNNFFIDRINNINNNINTIDNIINYNESLLVKSPNNNFMNEFPQNMNKFLFPGINPLSLFPSMNNRNFLANPINPLNYNIEPISMNIPENSSINNYNINANINDKK